MELIGDPIFFGMSLCAALGFFSFFLGGLKEEARNPGGKDNQGRQPGKKEGRKEETERGACVQAQGM